jgi:predicted transcriptional regulator
MNRASKLAPHHDLIVQARRDKVPEREIAAMIGVTRAAVHAYLQRNGLTKRKIYRVKRGEILILRDFTKEQLEHAERKAVKGGFESIAEYIVECARDKMEEEMT